MEAEGTYRPCCPPEDVEIDLGVLLGRETAVRWGMETQLRVRAAGLEVTGRVPGRLLARVQTRTGSWFGLVAFEVPARTGMHVDVRQLVPAAAITTQTAARWRGGRRR